MAGATTFSNHEVLNGYTTQDREPHSQDKTTGEKKKDAKKKQKGPKSAIPWTDTQHNQTVTNGKIQDQSVQRKAVNKPKKIDLADRNAVRSSTRKTKKCHSYLSSKYIVNSDADEAAYDRRSEHEKNPGAARSYAMEMHRGLDEAEDPDDDKRAFFFHVKNKWHWPQDEDKRGEQVSIFGNLPFERFVVEYMENLQETHYREPFQNDPKSLRVNDLWNTASVDKLYHRAVKHANSCPKQDGSKYQVRLYVKVERQRKALHIEEICKLPNPCLALLSLLSGLDGAYELKRASTHSSVSELLVQVCKYLQQAWLDLGVKGRLPYYTSIKQPLTKESPFVPNMLLRTNPIYLDWLNWPILFIRTWYGSTAEGPRHEKDFSDEKCNERWNDLCSVSRGYLEHATLHDNPNLFEDKGEIETSPSGKTWPSFLFNAITRTLNTHDHLHIWPPTEIHMAHRLICVFDEEAIRHGNLLFYGLEIKRDEYIKMERANVLNSPEFWRRLEVVLACGCVECWERRYSKGKCTALKIDEIVHLAGKGEKHQREAICEEDLLCGEVSRGGFDEMTEKDNRKRIRLE